jgi:hypothetical protein
MTDIQNCSTAKDMTLYIYTFLYQLRISTHQMHFQLFKVEIHTIENCKQSKVISVSTIYLAKSKFITCGTILYHSLSTPERPTSNSGPISSNHLASFWSSWCLGVQGYNNRPDKSVSSQLKCRHLFLETAVDKWP